MLSNPLHSRFFHTWEIEKVLSSFDSSWATAQMSSVPISSKSCFAAVASFFYLLSSAYHFRLATSRLLGNLPTSIPFKRRLQKQILSTTGQCAFCQFQQSNWVHNCCQSHLSSFPIAWFLTINLDVIPITELQTYNFSNNNDPRP